MKKELLQLRYFKAIFGLMLMLGLLAGITNDVSAQKFSRPGVPILSLTGQANGYEAEFYPDGRIWMPVSADNDKREFLMPVWVSNRWMNYSSAPQLETSPIHSFSFSLIYDKNAIRAIGVQKFGPFDEDLGEEPLAKDFNLSWDEYDDQSYKTYWDPTIGIIERRKGRAIRISGSSTTPLPNTNRSSDQFKILLYIRFQVQPETDELISTVRNTPIYIKPDTIRYNTFNVREDNPFEVLKKLNVKDVELYDPEEFTGIAGINNRDMSQYTVEPTLPGTIYLQISDEIPQLELQLGDQVNPGVVMIDNKSYLWELTEPITIDSASFDPLFGKRRVRVINNVTRTRLLNLNICTDEPWLKIQSVVDGPNDKIAPDLSTMTRCGDVNWLDNNILGDQVDPFGEPTDADGSLNLEINCDPNALELGGEVEKTGKYVGWVTFTSSYMINNPTRLKVTFIYFRNPVEWFSRDRRPGIHLTIRNSRGAIGDSTKLIFGTGHRATDGVDSLFGEYAYVEPLQGFGARFYPLDPAIRQFVPFGFGDMAPNRENPRTRVLDEFGNPRYGSRDIRSNTDTLTSILYWVRFNADGAGNYPVTVEWDTTDFPPGAQLFLRDSVNGSHFNVNMRKATPLGGSRFSYVIADPRWSSFIIEYTLPRVIRYVDREGNPLINTGWNLLSLAVRPTNNDYRVFYPRAINKPFLFTQNQYQVEENLRIGTGYFVKYPEDGVDTTFAGTFISHISQQTGDVARLYRGWNTIGALSSPVSIQAIELDAVNVFDPPNVNVSFEKGLYGYETDRGYKEISELKPGLGYWLYVDKGAYLNLRLENIKSTTNQFVDQKQNILDRSAELVIRDNSHKEYSLYLNGDANISTDLFQLPPQPPHELFDARFDNNAILSNTETSVVKLQGVDYPVMFAMDNPDANYTVMNPVTNEVYGTIEKGRSGNVIISDSRSDNVQIIKSGFTGDFALANYPNPVETSSTVRFAIPDNQNVTLALYDAMGNKVQTLLNNEYRTAGGYEDVTIDASTLASGSYILKLTAGSFSKVTTVNVVK